MSDRTEWKSCERGRHGVYIALFYRRRPDGTEHWSTCPECDKEERDGTRAREQEQLRKEEEARRELAIRDKRANLIGASNVPPKYAKVRLSDESYITDTPAKLAAFQSIAQLFDGPPGDDWKDRDDVKVNIFDGRERVTIAICAGKVGTGKTRLACMLVNEFTNHLSSAAYFTERDLIRHIRSTWQKDSDCTEEEELVYLARFDLLVIDDVGTSLGTESEKAHLFDVLDARYRQEEHDPDDESDFGITVLVTNLDKKALAAYLGERLFDRLREDAIWIPFDWESQRGRKPKVVNLKSTA